MASSDGLHARYSRIPTEDGGNAATYHSGDSKDRRLDDPEWLKAKIPWRSVSLALSLLLIGSLALSLGVLMYVEHVPSQRDQMWGCFVIAFLTLVPGKRY